MISLIREQPSDSLGKREWWRVNSKTVMVAYGNGRCGVSISDAGRHDVTEEIAIYIRNSSEKPLRLFQTIDSILIESSPTDLIPLLQLIERIPESDL